MPIVHSRITFHKLLQSSYIRVLAHFLVILQGQHVCICLGLILELLEWNAAACNQKGNTNKLYVMNNDSLCRWFNLCSFYGKKKCI
jgi:hypothetical protein